MLNLSEHRIDQKVFKGNWSAFELLKARKATRIFRRLLWIGMLLFLLILFLPWTQNIRSSGKVTTLYPNQRPQQLNSIIAGRIEKWYVREGDEVQKGDTILFISEIKDEYFDPNLLERTEEQIQSKELTVDSYMSKFKALDAQIDALNRTRRLKLEQAKNYIKQARLKIQSDSIDYQASKQSYEVAERQLVRMEEMYKDGLNSLTEVEARRVKAQDQQAKLISAENKLIGSKNEYLNAEVELSSIESQYRDKLAKNRV